MKRYFSVFFIFFLLLSCGKETPTPEPQPDPQPQPVASGSSGITYQLLVYSFADSNGDGIGDFNGIVSKLDYLKSMGVEALWLSPIHPATSYHGYDVEDYASVNSQYGTEADFKALVDAAHAKGIKIYLDYVLNHTSKNHPWFLDAKTGAGHGDYYMISANPEADIKAGKFPMIPAYNSGEWSKTSTGTFSAQKVKFTLGVSAGKPSTIRMDVVSEVSNTGTQNSGFWLYYGDGQMAQFYNDGGRYTLSLELDSSWGVLIRTSTDSSWPVGTKYGGQQGSNTLVQGATISLRPSSSSYDPADLLLPGMEPAWYLSVFGSYMPDINYGAVATCEQSAPFVELTEAACKWIDMGIDGFRLDAVKHIYHDERANPEFLRKFYDRCNAAYKAAGHSDDFYIVGEQFSEPQEVAPYYKGIPALFEFGFWWRLSECIRSADGQRFASLIKGYHDSYAVQRNGAIAATKLSNHDEDRAASTLGRNAQMLKLAAAVLLTCGGSPYIYQGEELGYWGTKSNGDEYVRTPILWTSSLTSAADKALGGKVDKTMLSASISVENQGNDPSSMLAAYRKFGSLRGEYVALGEGDMTICNIPVKEIAAWYRSAQGQKLLVMHNFGGSPSTVTVNDEISATAASSGTVSVSNGTVKLGSYASAVFVVQ